MAVASVTAHQLLASLAGESLHPRGRSFQTTPAASQTQSSQAKFAGPRIVLHENILYERTTKDTKGVRNLVEANPHENAEQSPKSRGVDVPLSHVGCVRTPGCCFVSFVLCVPFVVLV